MTLIEEFASLLLVTCRQSEAPEAGAKCFSLLTAITVYLLLTLCPLTEHSERTEYCTGSS